MKNFFSFLDQRRLFSCEHLLSRTCGFRGYSRLFAAILAICFSLCLTTVTGQAQPLTRAQAAAALLAPGSGVSIDVTNASVWSPFVDYGFGSGSEGLLPVGSVVNPHELGWLPYPGPGMSVSSPSYFFWIDDFPGAQFQHPVRFALVDASNLAPTVANGGIVVTDQGWWPVVTAAGGSPVEFFHNFDDIATADPPGPGNPKGLIAGSTLSPGGGLRPAGSNGPDGPNAPTASNPCGLLLRGDTRFDFAADIPQFMQDLMNHYGVSSNRIVKANGGNPASSGDLAAGITAICNMTPPCDKIYVRITSHGSKGGFSLTDGTISSSNLCNQFKKLADKGVPICLIINSCYSGSLLDPHNWNFPAGSVIMTSTDSNHIGYGWNWIEGTNKFTGSAYPSAYSHCLNANPTNNPGLDKNGDGFVDDVEAHRWVTNVQPCYARQDITNEMYYPAGSGTNANPGPQVVTVGTDPTKINLNVCNGSGQPKTDFHIIFKGNVSGGTALAWQSDAQDHIGPQWAGGATNRTVTYDPTRNETMVCWMDGSAPVASGQYIHFGYFPPNGGLRPLRQYWTPTTNPPAINDRVPTRESSVVPGTNASTPTIRIISRSEAFDGWGQTQLAFVLVRYTPTNIPLDRLNLGDPAVSGLTPLFVTNFFLDPDVPIEFPVTLPMQPNDPEPSVVLESRSAWEVNQTQTIQVELIPMSLVSAAPLMLHIENLGGAIRVTWDATDATLEVATDLTGSWTALITATSPYFETISPGTPMKFFRLHRM
ncbi:MAG: hypothetical protein HY298_24050 [Verrucomicrobia bacterium]|nr:hypothetical protein [Verrucomicrobiota bacterium]